MDSITSCFSMADKAVLVTGGSSGLGSHFADVLAKAGAKIILAARDEGKLQAKCNELKNAGYQADYRVLDVTKAPQVLAAFEEFGASIDVLINNSGVGLAQASDSTNEEDWQNVVDTNLSGAWRVAAAACRNWKSAGKAGVIVNIASITALQPARMLAAYGASKAALLHLTKLMALEMAPANIRINALCPGYFITPLNQGFLTSEFGEQMRQRVPMKRFGEFADLDGPLLLLASDAGAYMTGSMITIDGGHVLQPL